MHAHIPGRNILSMIRHSPLSSMARRLLLDKLGTEKHATPAAVSSLMSELSSLMARLKENYPRLHVEECNGKDREGGWLVISR